MCPHVLASLEEDEVPEEHMRLFREIHAVKCLSVEEVVQCGASPAADPVDTLDQREEAFDSRRKRVTLSDQQGEVLANDRPTAPLRVDPPEVDVEPVAENMPGYAAMAFPIMHITSAKFSSHSSC